MAKIFIHIMIVYVLSTLFDMYNIGQKVIKSKVKVHPNLLFSPKREPLLRVSCILPEIAYCKHKHAYAYSFYMAEVILCE